MNAAAATAPEPVHVPSPAVPDMPPLSAVDQPAVAHEAAEARAEGAVMRGAAIGAAIGAVVCAPLWVLLVLIALRDSGTALGPPLWMAAGVGVIAGVFLGGWAGTLVGSTKLEHFERDSRPKAPNAQP